MNNSIEQPVTSIFKWFGQSALIKLFMIGVLTLLLLIPSSMIQSLIHERQQRQEEVIGEVSDKWSGSQLLQGPVLVLPYKTMVRTKDNAGKENFSEVISQLFLLPEKLDITGKADPEVLHRGIFDAVVYNSKLVVTGNFGDLELKKSGINPDLVLWDKAKVAIGISDLKGLKNNPSVKLGDAVYSAETDFSQSTLFSNNLIVLPDLSAGKSTRLNFSFDLDIRGSSELNFMHLGKSTTVRVNGPWTNPSFTGRYLPEDRKVADSGFDASWKMSYFNRPFPQQWLAKDAALLKVTDDAVFGVKFILPVDQYQKTMRSAKYAILIILLTFVSLFFTEILGGKRVHLLQYVLIGAAMTIYYTLLLAFSEQVGFNIAYLIASVATVLLIGFFIGALLRTRKPALVFSLILTIFYSFIFVIIQLQDLALLFGSVGLFVIIAVMMYLSARIDWIPKPVSEVLQPSPDSGLN